MMIRSIRLRDMGVEVSQLASFNIFPFKRLNELKFPFSLPLSA